MQSLSEILGVGILTHACGKGRNSAQNLPFGRKLSGCRKGDACPGDVVWEASPSHLQGAGFGAGGEVPVAPVDPPRITCAGISLSPSGVVGSVWGCRGNKVNSRGFLEWYPPVDSLASLPPAGDALHSPAGVRHRRGRCQLQAAGSSAADGAWEPGLQVQSCAAAPWLCKNVPLPRFPHLSSESQWRVGWGDASSLRTCPALSGWAGEEGQSVAVLEQCSDTWSGVDLGTFSSPAGSRPSPPPPPPGVLQVASL